MYNGKSSRDLKFIKNLEPSFWGIFFFNDFLIIVKESEKKILSEKIDTKKRLSKNAPCAMVNVSCNSHARPTDPFIKFYSLKLHRPTNSVLFETVDRRISRLLNCERASQAKFVPGLLYWLGEKRDYKMSCNRQIRLSFRQELEPRKEIGTRQSIQRGKQVEVAPPCNLRSLEL